MFPTGKCLINSIRTNLEVRHHHLELVQTPVFKTVLKRLCTTSTVFISVGFFWTCSIALHEVYLYHHLFQDSGALFFLFDDCVEDVPHHFFRYFVTSFEFFGFYPLVSPAFPFLRPSIADCTFCFVKSEIFTLLVLQHVHPSTSSQQSLSWSGGSSCFPRPTSLLRVMHLFFCLHLVCLHNTDCCRNARKCLQCLFSMTRFRLFCFSSSFFLV